MRKDDMSQDDLLSESGEDRVVTRRRMDEDAELDDVTLLGASTLAKLDVDKEEIEVIEDLATDEDVKA
jgi:hypothetical protein